MTKFGKQRKNIPLSNNELAKKLGVSERTIRRWINGTSKPKIHIFTALRALLF